MHDSDAPSWSMSPFVAVADAICLQGIDCAPRTICTTPLCPPGMHRTTAWVVDDFLLAKQLYKGKASVLFQAVCRRSTNTVALKLYRKHKLSQLNWFQVEREIRIHSQLDHPNIIKLYGAFEDGKHVYLVQEYAAGGDLYQELKRSGGRFSEAHTAANLLHPFLHAVSYLHDRGVIHRDIKPENILLTDTKMVKLADFGLSICWTQERPVTRAGTLDYMAPEALLCPEKTRPEENKEKLLLGYSSLVDCWASGVLAFELLTGRPPFEQDTREATCEHIMYHKALHPPWMPEDARAFISAALSKDLLHHPWMQRHMQATARPSPAAAVGPPAGGPAPAAPTPTSPVNGKATAATAAAAAATAAKAVEVSASVFYNPSAAPATSTVASMGDAGQGLEDPPGGLRVFLRTASSTVKHLLHNPVGTLRSIMEPVVSPTTSTAPEDQPPAGEPVTSHFAVASRAPPAPLPAPHRAAPAGTLMHAPVHVVVDARGGPQGPVISTTSTPGTDKSSSGQRPGWGRSASVVSSSMAGGSAVALPQLVAAPTPKPSTSTKAARRDSPQRSPSTKAAHGGASVGFLPPKTAGPLPTPAPGAVALQILPREGAGRAGQRVEEGRLRRGMSSSTSAPALRALEGEGRSH